MIGGLLGGISALMGPLAAEASAGAGAAVAGLGTASGFTAFANCAQSEMQANYAQL